MELIGPLTSALRERLLSRVQVAVRMHGLTSDDLSRLCAVSEESARCRDPDWNPTDETLAVLEGGLSAAGFLDTEFGANIVVARRDRVAGDSRHVKSYLSDSAARLDPQLGAVFRYCNERVRDGRLQQADIELATLDKLAPDCAIHLYDVGDDPGQTVLERWSPVPDYRGGRDFTGRRIADEFDAATTACILEDVAVAVELGGPHWTFIHRRAFWPEIGKVVVRNFLRLFWRLEGVDDRAKLLMARRLKPPAATRQFVGDLRSP